MAQAPTPGHARANAEAGKVIRITCDGETLEFLPAALTLEDRLKIRKEVGLPFEAFVAGEASIGEDTLALWWWLAQRQNHRPNLSWKQFGFEWHFDPDKFDVELVEDDTSVATDLPEGSGPGSETSSLA